ncbi:MAG TPA: hypothetical protein VIP98_22150, partial [Microlunatus sp.]
MSRADGPTGSRSSLHPTVKITPPRVPAGQVSRDRLLATLDDSSDDTVVLLSAPAGAGKTHLLAEWAANRRDPTAWVTLDHADNDERRFWSALVSALRGCAAVPAAIPLARAGLPGTRSLDVAYVTAIAEAIHPAPVTLILDDIHELTDPLSLQGLGDLITYGSPQIRLVLSGRFDPALRLGRLRLDGRLLALRGADLAFTADETELLLGRAGLSLSSEQIRMLQDQTRGWAAGLRLAALAMRTSEPATVLKDLVGTTHTISEYLVGEVLSSLSSDARSLLDATAICTRFTTGLAQRLSGLTEAGSVLAELEATNSLITSFGDGRLWFQVHPLLRAHLQMDLHRFHPEREARLHRAAADWFEGQGQYDQALRQAIAAADQDLCRRVLDRHAVRLLMTGQHALLRSAAAELPPLFQTEPRLALVLADAHLEVGDFEAARRFAEAAAAHWPVPPDPVLTELWILVTGRLNIFGGERIGLGRDPVRPVRTGSRVRGDPETEALVLLARATGAVGDGRDGPSRQLAEAVTVHGRNTGNGYLAARGTALQALAAARTGDRAEVTELSMRASTLVAPQLWRGTA